MAYERKDNSFSTFKNTRKTTDTHPVLTGSALVGGVQYFVDIWFNTDKNGDRYASGTFKPKLERAAEIRSSYDEPDTRSGADITDDDLPF